MYASPQDREQPWIGARTPQPDAYAGKSMWRGTVVLEQPGGPDESFAIGPDGFVWHCEFTRDGECSGRLRSTGLQGELFAVGRTGTGQRLVVAAGGGVLCHVAHMQGADGAHGWSAPVEAALPRGMDTVERLVTQTHFGHLFVGMVLRTASADGAHHHCFWDAMWTDGTLVIAHSPVDAKRGNVVWLERLAQEGIVLR